MPFSTLIHPQNTTSLPSFSPSLSPPAPQRFRFRFLLRDAGESEFRRHVAPHAFELALAGGGGLAPFLDGLAADLRRAEVADLVLNDGFITMMPLLFTCLCAMPTPLRPAVLWM